MTSPRQTEAIRSELDASRSKGDLRQVQIPPCPDLLTQLQRAMNQAEPDLGVVAHIASQDVAMSAALIRLANSALYKPMGPPCATVGQAMTRLGLRETAQVLSRLLAQNAIPVNNRQLARFWERSAKRAAAMAFIASQLPGMSVDLAHGFGLFQHVGMPVLLQSMKGYASTMVEANARIDRPFIATENANHRTDHAVVGALVVRVWNLPPLLMTAVRLHHDFEALGAKDVDPDVHALIAASLIAEWLMRRHEGLSEDADWAANHAAAMAWLHVQWSDLEQWEEALLPIFDQT
jgi:HD-like signal output (HDOD) protein